MSQENVIFFKKLMKIDLFCIVQQASGQGVPEIIGQVSLWPQRLLQKHISSTYLLLTCPNSISPHLMLEIHLNYRLHMPYLVIYGTIL